MVSPLEMYAVRCVVDVDKVNMYSETSLDRDVADDEIYDEQQSYSKNRFRSIRQ